MNNSVNTIANWCNCLLTELLIFSINFNVVQFNWFKFIVWTWNGKQISIFCILFEPFFSSSLNFIQLVHLHRLNIWEEKFSYRVFSCDSSNWINMEKYWLAKIWLQVFYWRAFHRLFFNLFNFFNSHSVFIFILMMICVTVHWLSRLTMYTCIH